MKVALRELRREDLPLFFEHQRDPEALKLAAFTSRDENAFMKHWEKILKDPAVSKKTILLDQQAVGLIVCFERDGKRELGYWIGREHWGKGIASRAVREFLLDEHERPLYGVVAKHNTASIRILEKCGFVVVGKLHETEVEELIMRKGDRFI